MELGVIVSLLVFCLLCYALWKLTIQPLLTFGPLLRKVGVCWPNGLPPPIGHSLQYYRDSEETIVESTKVCLRLKSGVPYIWYGTRPMFIVNTPEVAQTFLHDPRLTSKGSTFEFMRPALQNGIFASSGEKWRSRRKLLTPAFHFGILKFYFITIKKQTETLIQVLSECTGKGCENAIDVREPLSRYGLDVICETTMGIHPNAQKNDIANTYFDAISSVGETVFERSNCMYFWFDWIFYSSPTGRRFLSSMKFLYDFSGKVILSCQAEIKNARLKAEQSLPKDAPETSERLPFLKLLLSKLEEDNPEIDISDIKEEVTSFILAGHDTSSQTLVWILQSLGENLKIQSKVHEELDSIFKDDHKKVSEKDCFRELAFEDLSKLSYMDKVIREALRLHPPAPYTQRGAQAETPVKINGQQIVLPRGALALIYIYAIHRDPEIYPNPEKFDPDRFDTELVSNRHSYAYIPFGGGPRGCLGQKFAMMEIKTALTEILKRFKVVAMQSEKSVRIVSDMVLKPRTPVMIKFIPR